MSHTPSLSLHLPAAWWLVIPAGYDELDFYPREGDAEADGSAERGSWERIVWKRVRWWRWVFCCGGRFDKRHKPGITFLDPKTAHIDVRRRPTCGRGSCDWRLALGNLFWSFILAFLVHLVPSIIWGAANSLGSPGNHGKMGAVWFSLWPVFFAVMSAAQPYGITTADAEGKQWFVQTTFATRGLAEQIVQTWQRPCSLDHGAAPGSIPGTWRPQTIAGTGAGLALIANALYTGYAVMVCMGNGCCRDDAATLLSCASTGFPS